MRARLLGAVLATALAFGLCARMERRWVVVAWVGLVPWLAALDRTASVREALEAGLLMCVAFVLAVYWWFAGAIASYTGVAPATALVLLLVAAPLLEPQLVAFALARHLCRRRGAGPWWTAATGAAVWLGVEWLWPKLFPDTLGDALYPSTWMRQAADVAGVPGLTLVLLAANELALAAWRRRTTRAALAPAAGVAALAAALAAYGAVRCAGLGAGEAPVTAAVVQADLAHYDRMAAEVGTFEAVRRILDVHFALSREALARADPDVVVWPETVYPTTFGSPKSPDGAAFDREIVQFVAGAGRPLVFGSYDREDGDEYNAAVFLAPATDGRPAFDAYRKASLFPLTERVPPALESALVRRWLPWVGSWKPGRGAAVLPLALRDGRTLRVAPLICYDAVDPRLARAAVRQGAELILTLSNDSWFASGAGGRLHLAIAAFRSVETRRPQIRATNTGISAVIDARGELVRTTDVDERTVLVGTVRPERRATTLALAWGEWLGPPALAAAVVLLATMARPRRTSARDVSRRGRGPRGRA